MASNRRGAPLKTLDDPSAPGEGRIDVGVRIGWVLRMARLTAGDRALSQVAMVRELERRGLPMSSTTGHRVETGARRVGAVVDAYEEVLDLPAGTLRAPIDILCRTFPYSPPDRDPGRTVSDLPEMEAALHPVTSGKATGGEWLRWARASAGGGGLGMPRAQMQELVEQCLGEMLRSWGTGYHTRYEALALLRCGPYGEVVLATARDLVADPHVQQLADAASLVGECLTPDAVQWAGQLLEDPRDHVSSGGVLCLENLLSISADPGLLEQVEEQVVRAYRAAEPDTDRWRWLTHLVRLMPREQHARVRARLDKPLAPALAPSTERGADEHWRRCEALARGIAARLGIAPQPLLARLLFELAVGPFETRGVTSGMLLRSQPALVGPVADAVAELGETHPDALVRARALRRLVMLEGDVLPERVAGWLDSPDPRRQVAALRLAASTTHEVPREVLERALARPETRRAALVFVGQRSSPLLEVWAAEHPEAGVRGAFRWWQQFGALDRELLGR